MRRVLSAATTSTAIVVAIARHRAQEEFRRRDDARPLQEAANTSYGMLLPSSSIRRAFMCKEGEIAR